MVIAPPKTTKYTHSELGKDIRAGISGYYTPQQEVRLKYHGREVLYVVGQVVLDCSCCANGSWTYAVVPGYIVNWQNTKNEDGRPVSEVEPIIDREAREDIAQLIQTSEGVFPIDFL